MATETIYVVDSDPQVRNGVCDIAATLNMKCEAFESAGQYLESGSGRRPGCLVTEIKLQDMDGLEFQKHILEQSAPIPIIVISAHADVSTAVRLMENGAITLLEKPFPTKRLAEAIQHAVDMDLEQLELVHRFQELHTYNKQLSERERQVLEEIVDGNINRAIAVLLDVSERTVESDRSRILKKFDAESATELAAKFTEYRILSGRKHRIDRIPFKFRVPVARTLQDKHDK